jgi:hypothetical protein
MRIRVGAFVTLAHDKRVRRRVVRVMPNMNAALLDRPVEGFCLWPLRDLIPVRA